MKIPRWLWEWTLQGRVLGEAAGERVLTRWANVERRAALGRAALTSSGFICLWGHSAAPGGLRLRQLQKRIQAGKGEASLRNLREGWPACRHIQSASLSPWDHAHLHLPRHRWDSYHSLQHSVCTGATGSDFQSPSPQAAGSPRPLERTNQASRSGAALPTQSPESLQPAIRIPVPSPRTPETPPASDVSGGWRGMWQHQLRPWPQVPP